MAAQFYKRKCIDTERARELYDTGLCDLDIAVELCISREAVCAWRARNGLPCHPQAKKKEPPKRVGDSIITLAAEAKKRGMSYGQYMVAKSGGLL